MIVLDTHALIWYMGQSDQLSSKALKKIDMAREQNAVYVSAMSAWEMALLEKKKRLQLEMPVVEWLSHCEQLPFLHFVPIDHHLALQSVGLSDKNLPDDPADRMIIATALTLKMPLLTRDKKIQTCELIETIW